MANKTVGMINDAEYLPEYQESAGMTKRAHRPIWIHERIARMPVITGAPEGTSSKISMDNMNEGTGGRFNKE